MAVLRDFTSGARPGRLVVISGRNTFSAAQVFLARVDHETKAEVEHLICELVEHEL